MKKTERGPNFMKHIFYIGQKFDKDGRLLSGLDKKRDIALEIVAKAFGGATMLHGYGAWMETPMDMVKEPMIAISTLTDQTRVSHVAKQLRELFNQSEVLVESTVVSTFVSKKENDIYAA